MKKRVQWLYFSLLILTAGCMVGPTYSPPENTTCNQWVSTEEDDADSLSHGDPAAEWWKIFQDPLLEKYIQLAAYYNNDLLTAESNILQARAMRTIAASSLFPQVMGDLNGTKTYFSKNGPLFSIGSAAGDPTITTSAITGLPFTLQVPQIQPLYNALFDVSWEIDLFGKNRRSVQAAEANIGSAIEHRNDVLVTILAEIAKTYVEIRSFQKQAILVEENISLLETNAKIVAKRKQTGYDNQLSEETIQAQLATARSQFPHLIAQVYQGIYTISVLTGNPPETLMEELLPIQPLPQIPGKIGVGLRSDLLLRRPDVRQAERQLAYATANIGVAVASFFPTVTLLGDGGFQSLKIGNLFSWNSRTWALGGDISIPIFQGGSLIGNLRAAEAATSAAAYTYQQTVLKALQEAETTLKFYLEDLETSRHLGAAVTRTDHLFRLTEQRYSKGLVGLLDVLTVEQQKIAAEQSLLSSDTSTLLDLISLYKALGGGWQPLEE